MKIFNSIFNTTPNRVEHDDGNMVPNCSSDASVKYLGTSQQAYMSAVVIGMVRLVALLLLSSLMMRYYSTSCINWSLISRCDEVVIWSRESLTIAEKTTISTNQITKLNSFFGGQWVIHQFCLAVIAQQLLNSLAITILPRFPLVLSRSRQDLTAPIFGIHNIACLENSLPVITPCD